MIPLVDGNVPDAATFNSNFAEALSTLTTPAQTVASPVTFDGAVTGASTVTVDGTFTTSAAEVKNVTVFTASSNYVATSTDRYVVVKKAVAAVTQVTLPAATIGRLISIVDGAGNSSTYNITVVPSGSDTIDNSSNYVISTNNSTLNLLGISGNWCKV